MKTLNLKYFGTAFFLCLLFQQTTQAQVGIGTTMPEGALDLETTSQGFVIPRVALTNKTSENPVVNPNGASLVEGTIIYNTSLTKLGANDVSPGIYAWDGNQWNPQFIKEDYKKYSQNQIESECCQRTTIRQNYEDPNPNAVDNVSGLTNITFEPKYSGRYKIEVNTNFAAGEIVDFTGAYDYISLATSEGAFFFRIAGPGVNINPTTGYFEYKKGWMYTHSYSARNKIESPNIIHSNIVPHFQSVTHYVYLLAEEPYTFTLSNCINTGDDYFLGNGDTGEGRGHIGHDIPCTVEFTFLGD